MVKNLKKLRESKQISQRQLAEEMGVSQQSINKYENQGVEPCIETLIALADFFDTSVDYLIGLSEINRRNEHYAPCDLNGEEQQLLSHYRKLSKVERESIRLVMENYLHNSNGREKH